MARRQWCNHILAFSITATVGNYDRRLSTASFELLPNDGDEGRAAEHVHHEVAHGVGEGGLEEPTGGVLHDKFKELPDDAGKEGGAEERPGDDPGGDF